MTSRFWLPEERSFLGPLRPTWGDLLRLRALRDMEQAVSTRIAALGVLPQSPRVQGELAGERACLDELRREVTQLENRLALL